MADCFWPSLFRSNCYVWCHGQCWFATEKSYTTTTAILWPAVRVCLGEPVPEEPFTHSHLSWSSIILYLLRPSTMIHSILPDSMCLTVFLHSLPPSPLWSISCSGTLHFILHTLLHPIIVFFSQHILLCCSIEIMSSNPSLCLSCLLGTLSFTLTSVWPFSSLPAEVPPHFLFLQARCHFHATYYFAHNCCTVSLSSSDINCLNIFQPIRILAAQLRQQVHPHSTCHLNSKTYPLTPDLHWHQYQHLYDLY